MSTSSSGPSRLSPRRLSGMPAFTVIWAGQFVSLFGSSMTRFAIGVWLYQQTGLATTFATMVLFSHLPRIALTPFAGALADRWNRKLTMMISDLATGLTTIAIFVLLRAGSLEIGYVYALVAFSSAFESFQWPAYSSAITMLVDKKHFSRTNAMLEMAHNGSDVLAPLLAASLLALIGIEGIVLIDVVTFTAAIGTLLMIPIPQPAPSETGRQARGTLLQDAVYGIRYIVTNPSWLGLQINFSLVNLMLGFAASVRTPMILARTGQNEFILGTVMSVSAVGSIVGSGIMSVWGGPKRKMKSLLIGLSMGCVALIAQGLGQTVVGWAAAGFALFAVLPLANASLQSMWQSKTPADVQGRVFAARRLIAQGSLPIAYALGGPLADRWLEPGMAEGGALAPIFGPLVGSGAGSGMSVLILMAGVVGATLPFVAGFTIRAVRDLEEIVPDVEVKAVEVVVDDEMDGEGIGETAYAASD